MRSLLILPLLALLGGCGFTDTGDAIRDGLTRKGAQAYDEGLGNAEWFICNAASVGSIMRRYGASPEKAAAWRALCTPEDGTGIIAP